MDELLGREEAAAPDAPTGAPDGSAMKTSTAAADAGTVDLDEGVDPPSWDEPFTDLQAELEKSCGSAAASSAIRRASPRRETAKKTAPRAMLPDRASAAIASSATSPPRHARSAKVSKVATSTLPDAARAA